MREIALICYFLILAYLAWRDHKDRLNLPYLLPVAVLGASFVFWLFNPHSYGLICAAGLGFAGYCFHKAEWLGDADIFIMASFGFVFLQFGVFVFLLSVALGSGYIVGRWLSDKMPANYHIQFPFIPFLFLSALLFLILFST